MPTPYEKEMERLRSLLNEVESEENSANSDEEEFSDHENFSEHNSESEIEEDDSEVDQDDVIASSDVFIGKDNCTRWKKEKFRTNGRTPARNIISHLPGPRGAAKDVTTPINSLDIFIDKNMIEKIVTYTNVYVEKVSKNFLRERDAKKTSVTEIRALMGLLYLCGLHKSSHLNVRDLWATDGTGIGVFHTTMSYKRFLFLLRCLRFDNVLNREERRRYNKLAPVRDIFTTFITKCEESYCVGEYVTIDEKLAAFRGRCSFRQYIPNKPSKYGIKIFALVDARTFYTSSMEIYAGVQPEGQFKVSNRPEDIVKRLMKPLFKSGRNLTTDNWYTSYPLAKYLLKEKITLVGTVRKDKREIPTNFKIPKRRPLHTSLFGFQKDATLVSYIPKKGRCVVLLSTMHTDDAIDSESGDKKKPEIITFYNLTKGAVDVVDEMEASYTTARKTNRWPMVIFFSMLNVAAINARIILLSKKEPPLQYKSRRLFLKDLSLCLIKEFVKERSEVLELPRNLHSACQKTCGLTEPVQKKAKLSTKGRCGLCPRNKDKKSSSVCIECNIFICKEHSSIVCKKCINVTK